MPFLVSIENIAHRNSSNNVYTLRCTYIITIITRRLIPFGSSSGLRLSLLVLRPQVGLLYQLPKTIECGTLVKVNMSLGTP